MRFLVLFVILMLSRLANAETPSLRPEIAVSPGAEEVVTAGLAVELRDFASANYAPDEVIAKTGRIEILPALKDGEEKTFSNSELVRLLKEKVASQPQVASMNWTYFVPEKFKIRASQKAVSRTRIQNQIRAQLNDMCGSCEFKIVDLKLPVLNEKSTVSEYGVETSSLKVAGGFLLPLRVQASGNETSYYVTGRVSTRAKALVTTKTLQMGEKIDSGDVRDESVEINYMGDAFATREDLLGKTSARYLQVGRPLYKSDLKKETLIQRGQIVRAISGNDLFEVSTQMQAEENGAVGDTVRIKNVETQKMMSGKVIDRGLVRIQ